jgi:3-oxoacyl-[acyl-carrier-protein] synthase II
LGALAPDGCYPFDRLRQGLALAEGGALFLLEPLAQAAARGATIYAEILGFGLQGDAYHRTAPDPQMAGARRAIAQCLAHSHLTADRIEVIHSHGTGTWLNDRSEGGLLRELFPHRPALLSTKGATGHTLGASGALAVALTCYALRDQWLPPCVGLGEPEAAIGDLNFVRHTRSADVAIALCESFGFGGNNGVIALKKA